MKKAVFKIFAVLPVILLFALLLRVGINIYSNQQLKTGFAYSDAWQDYKQQLPLSEMDFHQYDRCFSGPFTASYHSVSFTLSKPLEYYFEIADEFPAYIIPAGTELKCDFSQHTTDGCGINSFPTYQKGWRWVRPFLPTDSTEAPTAHPWYYVKTEDLEAVVLQMLNTDPYLLQSARNSGFTKHTAVRTVVRKTDNVFYENGIYLSPDLYSPIWTWDCTLLALAVFAASSIMLFLKLRNRKAP